MARIGTNDFLSVTFKSHDDAADVTFTDVSQNATAFYHIQKIDSWHRLEMPSKNERKVECQ